MIYSMTGFGRAEAKTHNTKVTVEIRAINSKQADISLRFPNEMRALEMATRKLVTKRLMRGKIDIFVTCDQINIEPAVTFNSDLARKYWHSIKELSKQIDAPMPLDPMRMILKMPGVAEVPVEDESETEALEQLTLQAIDDACTHLNEFREQEGHALYKGFIKNATAIGELLESVAPYEKERIQEIRQRIEEGLSKYVEADYDQNRLEQEMIFYIEKLDVNEEKNRLRNHIDYFIKTLDQEEIGQGRKLGFIAQEMGREINTLGSKSNHATLQQIVVKMKDELEQIKEQVLNVL